MSSYIERYAEFNYQLRQTNQIVDDIPADFPELTLESAYAIQDKLVAKLCEARSTERFGYKIGCTSEGAQQLLSTDGPVYGQMLNSGRYQSPVIIDVTKYTMTVIEPEFAFELNDDVPLKKHDAESISHYVAAVIPSIEVVHHHLGGWDRFDAPKTIADNAIHAFWVSGPPTTSLDGLDLPRHAVSLRANGTEVSKGIGEIALGNPLNALAWIANTLPNFDRSLKKGEIVTTGVCMPVYAANPGERIEADFGSLGEVVLQL